MISTMTKSDFKNWFRSSSYKNNFSYMGLDALFDYLEELEDDTGVKIEFDPIAICCDFVEYDSLEEITEMYDSIETLEDLEMETTVIRIYEYDGKTETGGYIIRDF
tara:strand:+ start:311 stop:628 length:318 start_codon:yes stop_codon:yes gene_type:complete